MEAKLFCNTWFIFILVSSVVEQVSLAGFATETLVMVVLAEVSAAVSSLAVSAPVDAPVGFLALADETFSGLASALADT